MKKLVGVLLTSLLIIGCGESEAGFVTGMLVGSALTSSSSGSASPSTSMISSDTHDVISCKQHHESVLCHIASTPGNTKFYNDQHRCWCVSPEQYVKIQGYTTLHKVATQFVDGNRYLMLEVSKE